MENFYLIHECSKNKFKVYLNQSNKDLVTKFVDINRNPSVLKKFILVIEAVKIKAHNKTQYNWEMDLPIGSVYAIKVDSHRFYTLQIERLGCRELYICRYGKKESQENSKKLTSTITAIESIEIQKILCHE
jgi:hypothetical protein